MNDHKKIEFYPTKKEKSKLKHVLIDLYYSSEIYYKRAVNTWDETWIVKRCFDGKIGIYYSESLWDRFKPEQALGILNKEHKKQFLIELGM